MKVLVVGGRVAAFAALGMAGLWLVLALLTWGDLVNGPRVSSPFSTFGYGQAALFSAPVNLLHVLGTLAWNAAAMVIGYALVIRPVWGGKHYAGAGLMALAGVVPGTLLIGAVARIVTLFAPNAVAAPLIALFVASASAWAAIALWPQIRLARSEWRGVAVMMIVAVLGGLVFQLHVDRGHAVAEGSIWFINTVFLSEVFGVGAGGSFPLVTQHYDEAAFLLAPIYLLVRPGEDASAALTLIYWITLSVTRLGMIALTYIALRGLGLDRFSGFACTAFVCAASMSLNPFSSRLLFDSLSPLLYALHGARFLAPILPLLIVSALMQGGPRIDMRAIALAVLLGLGLSAMPVHLAIVAPWALALVLLVALNPAAGERSEMWRAAAAVAACVLLAVSAVYGLQFAPDTLRAGLLAASGVLGGLWLLWRLLGSRVAAPSVGDRRALAMFLVVLFGYGVGLLFLGNVAFGPLQSVLAEVWPYSGHDVLSRLEGDVVSPSATIAASPFCATGYEWGYRTLTGHCGSLPVFVRTYGLPFALMAAVLGWRALRGRLVVDARFDTTLLWSIALCLLALPVAFILFDFITPSVVSDTTGWSIWLRSRAVEPWFVGGVLLALAFFLRGTSDRARGWVNSALVAAAAVHILNPLVASSQWVANVAYWVAALLGS